MEKQFHICSKIKELKEENMKPIQNHTAKPRGGFWTSTFEDTYGSDWIQWLINERYQKENVDISGYLLIPKKEVKLYIVDSFEDCQRLLREYLYINPAFEKIIEELRPNYEEEALHQFYGIDYEKMQQSYDGLHLTRKGFVDCHIKVGEYNSSLFHGFDCESTIWFDWVFEKIEYIKTKVIRKKNWNVYEIASKYREGENK